MGRFRDWSVSGPFVLPACPVWVTISPYLSNPIRQTRLAHLATIRSVVGRLAEEAQLRDPDSFARSWHILMKGSIVSAAEGDAEAAQRARSMAQLLIEQHR